MKLSLGSGWLRYGFRGFVSIFTVAIVSEFANAQVIPDGTLGTEGSIVTGDVIRGGVGDRISGGARRGQNLFHSFSQFDVRELRSAYFENPTGVQNIFSRVTGSDRSEILGRLGVLGGANLFFMNPNGILFGANASLDVEGSFAATTANAIKFGSQGSFTATNPELPSQLLTINPSAFLFNQIPIGNIVNNSTASTGSTTASGAPVVGLEVPNGQSLLLVGGDVNLEGGSLNAIEGQIALGGLASSGTVGLELNNRKFNLLFPAGSQLSNVTLSNDATVNVRGTGEGSITVNADIFSGTTGGRLNAGSDGFSNGGDITINAEQVSFDGIGRSGVLSGIYQTVSRSGSAGDILVNTKSLNAAPGSQIYSLVESGATGNAGNLTVSANSIEMSGTGGSATRTRIGSETRGIGNSGNVAISTRQLTISNGAILTTNTLSGSQGNGGALTVNASDSVRLVGVTEQGVRAAIAAQTGGGGRGGSIEIKTRQLTIENGPIISVNALERTTGQAGNLTIKASDAVRLSGVSATGIRAALSAQTGGSGRGGSIDLETKALTVQDGAIISVNAIEGSTGQAGNLTINASDLVQLSGVSATGSRAALGAQTGGSGQGGNIGVTTKQLLILNGAVVSANAVENSSGRGGSVVVKASELIRLAGISPVRQLPSVLNARTQGSGRAGDVDISTAKLEIQDDASISSRTEPESTGDGGTVSINSDNLTATSGAQILADSLGQGNAGNIQINVRNRLELNNSSIVTAAPNSSGGNISVNTARGFSSGVIVLRNSDITTESGTNLLSNSIGGDGGNITLLGAGVIALGDSNIVARALQGRGGNITLSTFFSETLPPGNSDQFKGNGRVDVNARGTVSEGRITTGDTTLIQNSLSELQQTAIDPDTLIANSCIARTEQGGTFLVTGAEGLRDRPGDPFTSNYPLGNVRSLPETAASASRSSSPQDRPWQLGDPIVEPQGVYRLSNGRLMMSRECS